MRDIAERLRSRAWEDRHHRKYREEAATEIESLRILCTELAEALRVYHGCSYPVATEINPKGYVWSHAYLDQAKPIGEKALAKYRKLFPPPAEGPARSSPGM